MAMRLFSIVGGLSILVDQAFTAPTCPPTTFTYDAGIVETISVVDLVSNNCYLDGPKVRPVNASTYDWWYFDTVSEDLEYSLSVQFLAAPGTALYATGFPPDQILATVVQVTTPEGASLYGGTASGATVVTNGHGASGLWKDTGMSFTGSPDLSFYVVNIDNADIGLKATLALRSIAPAHYPGGPAVAGQNMEVIPGIGWANAVPDANGSVSLEVNGTEINFKGSGYHDKNWGDSPFEDRLQAWYWGHGRVGPYSIVWFESIDPKGAVTLSSYVAENGNIIFASASGLKVRPLGGSSYPPSPGDHPTGYSIQIDMGSRGVFEAKTKSTTTVYDGLDGTHTRWIGSISGGLKNGPTYSGTAYYEQFAL